MAFKNPIVSGEQLLVSGIRSADYVESVSGLRIGADGTAQVQSLAATQSIASPAIDGTILSQDGETLDDIQAPFSQGLTGWLRHAQAVETWNPAGEKVMQITVILQPGRIYRCRLTGFLGSSTVAGDQCEGLLRFTQSVDQFTVPATPTTASPNADGAQTRWWGLNATGGIIFAAIHIDGFVSNLTSVPIQCTVGFFVSRITGTGSPQTFSSQGGRLTIEDNGLNLPDIGQNFAPGGGGGGGGGATLHDVTWLSTSVQTYGGLGAQRNDANGHTYGYQGFFTSQWGNQAGVFFFNSADIRAKLAGATILQSYYYISNVHTYMNSGVTWFLGLHNNDPTPGSYPGTFPLASFVIAEGAAAWSGDVGPSLGQSFRDGNARGFVIGPAPNNSLQYYSYFNATALRVVYQK